MTETLLYKEGYEKSVTNLIRLVIDIYCEFHQEKCNWKGGDVKKILLVSNEFPPIVGGAGVYLANLLSSIDLTKFHVTLIVPNRACLESCSKIRVLKVKELKGLSLLKYFSMINSLNLSDFSRIIINDPSCSLIFSFFFKKFRSKQIVFLHGLEPEQIFDEPRFLYRFLGYKKKYLDYLQNVFKVVFVSSDLEDKFNCSADIEGLNNRAILSPYINSSDFTDITLAPKDVGEEFSDDFSKHQTLLSVSRIEKKKGYLKLLDAIQPILENDSSIRWVIIGTGSYVDELKAKISQRGLSSQISIINQLPRKSLSYFYSKADVFVLLSEYRESFGLVYLEALSYGMKVMGNDYGGVSEVLMGQGELVPVEANVIKVTQIIRVELDKINNQSRDYHEINRYSKERFIKTFNEIIL